MHFIDKMLALQLQPNLITIDGIDDCLDTTLGNRVDADLADLLQVGMGQPLQKVDRPPVKVHPVRVQVPVLAA